MGLGLNIVFPSPVLIELVIRSGMEMRRLLPNEASLRKSRIAMRYMIPLAQT